MPDESDSAHSSSQTGKVISLRGHQAAEQLVEDMLAIRRSDPRFNSLVAKAFSLGAPLLSAVARRLDADQPGELLVLAEVAGRYPGRGLAVRALVRAANDRRASDTRRLGAALALGMYDYGVILPPLHDFLAGLSSPSSALAFALVSALDGYSHSAAPQAWEPLFALFLSQPPEVLFSAIGALGEAPKVTVGHNRASVLQLLALNPHPDVMAAAVEALVGQIDEASVRALATLQPNLPADMGHVVGRQLQKLRLSGMYDPSTPTGSPLTIQARLSAIDGRGRCLLSLTQDKSRVIELILSDTQGIIDAALNPAAQADGETGSAVRGAYQPLYGEQTSHRESLVTVPIGYSQGLLRRVVRFNWISGTSLPVAYLLECAAIWEAGKDQDEIAPDFSGVDLPATSEDESSLLSYSGFTDWYLDTPATHLSAQEIAASTGGLSSELTDENWRILLPSIIRLSHDEFVPDLRALYASRLRQMADWLYFGGEDAQSSLAVSAAYTMTHSPPEANLFVLRLVQKGILVALSQL